jgi:cGMP-dependent protein kinase
VKLVQHQLTNEVFALKCMKKEDIITFRQQKNVLTEKQLLFLCSNFNFVSALYSTYNQPNHLYMLMEYVQGGELLTHLYDRTDTIPRGVHGGFDLNCIQFYCGNLIEIFLYFESKNIIYRDLKPENILLDSSGFLKIVDFGFAKQLPYTDHNGEIQYKTYTLCGTQNYLAPELILSKGYDRSVDYWALGCLLYEFLVCSPPFDEEFVVHTYQAITSYKHGSLPFPEETPKSLIDLINDLLVADPVQRLGYRGNGVRQLQEQPFVADLNWEGIKTRSISPPYIPQIENSLDTSNFFDFDNAEDGDEIVEKNDLPYEGRQDYFDAF